MMRQMTVLLLTLTLAGPLAAEENWPSFRGPTHQGISQATGLPLDWSEDHNVTWKTAIHGRAWSTPIIWGDQIWLSTATEDGTELFAICVDRETGEIVHDIKLFYIEEPQFAHRFNTYASPSPVIEEGVVYITFGSPGTAALDTATGEVIWERTDFECNHFRGAGSSPVIFEDLLIMNFDGSDYQYVVAVNKHTGETVWRTDRSVDYRDLGPDGLPEADGDWRKGFSTPRIADFGDGPILLSAGSKALYGYDPRSGEELWRVEEHRTHSTSSTPVIGHGLIFHPTGLGRAELWATRPGGEGVVTETHVEWSVPRGVPTRPSVLLVDGLIYMVDDGGVASCIEAETGETVWRDRLGGQYSASPVYADGRIYFFSQEGKATAIAPGREFRVLAESELDEGFMASPAIAGSAFFLRTETHLYRIEE